MRLARSGRSGWPSFPQGCSAWRSGGGSAGHHILPHGRVEAERGPPRPLIGAPSGGCAVIAAGDFAQSPPIGETSLLGTASEQWAGNLRRGNLGRRLSGASEVAFKLRRVYRQKRALAFKDSTLRLRDAAMSLADHALWVARTWRTLARRHSCGGGRGNFTRYARKTRRPACLTGEGQRPS